MNEFMKGIIYNLIGSVWDTIMTILFVYINGLDSK